MTDSFFTSNWLSSAISALRQEKQIALATVIGPAGHTLLGKHVVVDEDSPEDANSDLSATARTCIATHSTLKCPSSAAAGAEILMLPYGPPDEAWIFGAGHIAEALAPLVARLGWRVVVCDDRAEYASRERFPDAHAIHVGDFAETARRCAARRHTWAILVTRGHQHDERIIRQLVHSRTRYVGMIGSKRRVQAVRDRLSKEDIPHGLLSRIHAPIGLPIGADSPAEIAVSILAEMIAVRRGADASGRMFGTVADTSQALPVWERATETISTGKPAVLTTIIARRGSTPRGLGAQMAVFADGSTSGTIGGGCGEEEIKRAAKTLLAKGDAAALVEVDLTGDPASESADVCGGRYTVLLELLRS
jgi:xanthine dehydrogenase accessory factor